MTLLITGGAGFIGSALVRRLVEEGREQVVVLDKLTYAGNLQSLKPVADHEHFRLEVADVSDPVRVREILADHRPRAVFHLAAESHVDRSIDGPGEFVHTNIVGTFVLLQEVRRYWSDLSSAEAQAFRFIHISTDEVFGSAAPGTYFTEETPYSPRSPYAASKAASDHLVQAWHHTYGFPCVTTNCSNNYGPYQFPEKLIPLVILNALAGAALPVYGDGQQVRDWLFVDDHVDALLTVYAHGRLGAVYGIGGNNEQTNLHVVRLICSILDEVSPHPDIPDRTALITHVPDRPGHDRRYAMDASLVRRELDWVPRETFESGLRRTVMWYLDNREWWEAIRSGVYRGERLGLGGAA